jgi:hypothetical protein
MGGAPKVTGFGSAEASRRSTVEEKVEGVSAAGSGMAEETMGMACLGTFLMADQVVGRKKKRQAK